VVKYAWWNGVEVVKYCMDSLVGQSKGGEIWIPW
jgi:hypothetical protein